MADRNRYELGRRAVACKHWRWMPGMRGLGVIDTDARTRVCAVASATEILCGPDQWDADAYSDDMYCDPADVWVDNPHWLPDLRDEATLGCLMRLVQQAWGEAWDNYTWNGSQFAVTVRGRSSLGNGPTVLARILGIAQFGHSDPAEALVAALEAAPD